MRTEADELLRFFLRKWSTIELTPQTRGVLREEAMHLQAMLEIHDHDWEHIAAVSEAPDRGWFAQRYHERFL